MTTYRKALQDEDGNTIIPAMTGDETEWLQTNDIADGAVTEAKLSTDLQKPYLGKHYWSGNVGGTWLGWIKIARVKLNNYNHFGTKIIDLKIIRDFAYYGPEVYDINICVAWGDGGYLKITQLNSSWFVHGITKVRVVEDTTNHWAYLEMYVDTGLTAGVNDTYVSMDVFSHRYTGEGNVWETMWQMQTEAESDLTVIGNTLDTS